MKIRILLILVISFTVFLVAHVPCSRGDREVEQVEEKSFDFEAGGTVKITANEGDVRVTTWDRSEVTVTMTKHARGKNKHEAQERLEEIDVRMDFDRDRLVIQEREQGDRSYSIFDLLDPDTWNDFSGRIVWVDFDLTVPWKTHLIVETDEGDISVDGLEGTINVLSDEGEMELRHIRSDHLVVVTDEGGILLEGVEPQSAFSSGRIDLDSDEGDVEIVDVQTGRLKIETDEADVMAEMLRCERLDFYSDEGTIDAELDMVGGGDYRCRTDEGEIILTLPRDTAFDVTARTDEGLIRSDFRLDIQDLDEGQRAEDTVNDGGADLYLFTGAGDIYLRERE
jgi:hypothetical protein